MVLADLEGDRMKTAIHTISIILLLAILAQAETYCQNVNRTGIVVNAAPLAKSMNKLAAHKGIKYKTTAKEMTNVITDFCKSNPYGTGEDVANHLEKIVDVAAAIGVR